MNDSKNLKEYVDRCTSHLNQYENLQNKKYSSEIYNDIGLGFYTINKFEMSKLYFNNAIKEAKKYKKVDIILSSMEKLLNIAADDKATNEVDNLKNQLIEIMSLNLLTINNTLIFKFIKYYNDAVDHESINDIVNFTKSLFSKYQCYALLFVHLSIYKKRIITLVFMLYVTTLLINTEL
ncbi:hypothetical protein [Clostridium sp. KNHs214]|uniref:hypothetical protein n=1 Tax=Clostridium sp. KNHs214 TaxID=1540257 RepID=UPI00163ACAEA|nr:hypothetical protein [Clostridium sp. KNHs214]